MDTLFSTSTYSYELIKENNWAVIIASIGTCRAVWVPGQDLATLHLAMPGYAQRL